MSKGDLGERSEDEVISDAARVCGAECNEVRREWYSLATLDKETVKYIELLHKSHPVYLLSNAISTFLRTIIYNPRTISPFFTAKGILAEKVI